MNRKITFLMVVILLIASLVVAEGMGKKPGNHIALKKIFKDFDFSKIDNRQVNIQDNPPVATTYGNLLKEAMKPFKSDNVTKKKMGLVYMTQLRDPRVIPPMITLLKKTKDASLKIFICDRLAEFINNKPALGDTAYPEGALDFAINDIAIPELKRMLSDTGINIDVSIAANNAIYFLGDKSTAYGHLGKLLKQGHDNALDIFFYKKFKTFSPSLKSKFGSVYDGKAKNFVQNYLQSKNEIIKAKAALYFLNIGDSKTAMPIAREIINRNKNKKAVNIAKRILKSKKR